VAAQTSAVCENLLDQLASTPAVIGTMPGARRYSSALTQQSMQIRQLRVEMRRMGCSSGSIVVFGGDHRAECGDLQAELDGLEDDKQAILDQRDAAGGRGRDNGRSSILAALETNGCLADGVSRTDPLSQEPEAEAIPDYRQVRGFDGNRDDRSPAEIPVYRDEGPSLGGAVPSMRGGLASADGGLRTMCVRTCDGAFFPISANASPQDFPHQADLCAQRCPGAQTELYFHSTTSQESADMVSTVTGAPYRSLPTAFAYKDRPPGQKSECGCTMAAGAGGAIQNRGAAPQSTAAYSGITDLSGKAPAGRQVTPPKPITTEAAVPKIVPPVVSAPTTPPAATASVAPAAPVAPATPVVPVAPAAAAAERPYDPNNKVRVVGPQFLPAQQTSSINLADPAVKGPQPLQQ
jgi:hypothetical protein